MRDERQEPADIELTNADELRSEGLLEDLEPDAEASEAVRGGDGSTAPTTNPTRIDPYKNF
jgi:hypothetical protein